MMSKGLNEVKRILRRDLNKKYACRAADLCSPSSRRRWKQRVRKSSARRPRWICGGIGRPRFQGRQDWSQQQGEST